MNKHEKIRSILMEYGCEEFGDCIIDDICEVFDYPNTNELNNRMFDCKICLSRIVEAQDEEEAHNKFWEDLEEEFARENTTLTIELNDSMEICEVKRK